MSVHKIIVAVAVCVVAVGATLAVVHWRSGVHGSGKLNANAEPVPRAGTDPDDAAHAKELETDSAHISSLITSNKDFAICRVREVEFGRDPMQDTGQCKLQDPFVWGSNSCNPYVSENEDGRVLESLGKSGYITILTYPNPDSNPYSEYVWVPTSRGRVALGSVIREQKSRDYRNGRLDTKWEIVLGCRELQQIDADSPLADGVKADFSWHWKTTELGTVEGLSESRQRGVAYFTRTSNGLNIDQIQFGSENTQ
jgi:hypothetical protein